MGTRSLPTILTAQGESGLHTRMVPMHSSLVVPVTAAAVMAAETCPTLEHWPEEGAPFTRCSLCSEKEKRQVKAHGSSYSPEKLIFPLWIFVNFINRGAFGLDMVLILHLRQCEELLTLKISNLSFQMGTFSTGGRLYMAHQSLCLPWGLSLQLQTMCLCMLHSPRRWG